MRVITRIYHLRQVYGSMPGHAKGKLSLFRTDPIDSRKDERRDIQHQSEGAQPGLVAVLRAEETEYRVGKVALQQLRCPPFPIAKRLVQRRLIRTATEPF